MPVTIKRDNDPFKKYWWVLLLGFGGVGLFVCTPIFSSNALSKVKSGVGRGEAGFGSSSDSLDSTTNPAGAPGSAMDLSMDGSGAYRKRSDGPVSSYLWGSGTAASGAPTSTADKDKDKDKDKDAAGADAGSMSASLNRAGKKEDPSGWGGVKAQRGFNAPKANFGGLSGIGSSGGGGTGMSMSGSGFGAANSGASFGSGGGGNVAGGAGNVQFGTNKALNSLRSARSVAMMASGLSGDSSANMGSRSFDGTGANANTVKNDKGKGFHTKLDTAMAPMNLKQEAIKKPETPEAKKAKKDLEKDKKKDEKEEEDWGMKLLGMVMNIVIGGLAGGMVNSMLGMQ